MTENLRTNYKYSARGIKVILFSYLYGKSNEESFIL